MLGGQARSNNSLDPFQPRVPLCRLLRVRPVRKRYSRLECEGRRDRFFVYTGEDMGDPHDEIDVELVGRGSGKVHVNSFRHGKGTAKDIDLGFDASEGVHLYAFEWLPGSITRFVNGVQVRRIAAPDAEIPTTTRRVMASVRVANRTSVDWVGEAEFVPTSAINPASV